MIKPLSNQKSYDLFYSGDPAITPAPPAPPDTADEKTKEEHGKALVEHARRLDVALDSGHWDDVTVQNETPTRFRFRQLTSDEYGDLKTLYANGAASFTVARLAFQIALLDASPMPEGVKVQFADIDGKRRATTSFLDLAGCGGELGATIVFELGKRVYQRAQGLSPKS